MFKFLKEKLKSWIKKSPEEIAEQPPKKVKKNFRKEISVKLKKKKDALAEIEQPKEKTEIQEIAESEQEIETKAKSRFRWFKKKITEEKFNELFEQLQLILLQNNTAYEVVEQIKCSLGQKLIGKNLSEANLQESLKESIQEILQNPPEIIKEIKSTLPAKFPFVIIFVGINGSGKTTTIAKFAYLLKNSGFSVCLAAADTFRAASIEQIQHHADNLQVPLIKKDYGADPASVGFDAIQYAKKHHIDVVLIDTAGRMQTSDSLMHEMEKIVRVNKPDMTIFVGESITGNDATQQAKKFADTIPLSGIILSKADVDEKAGAILSVSYVTGKPIFFLGTGQKYEDLKPFNKEEVIKNLL